MLFQEAPFSAVQRIVSCKFTLLYGCLSTVAEYYDEMYETKKYTHTLRTLPEGISLNLQDHHPSKIYYVVGESEWRKHMSIYDYPIQTTPFLDSLYNVYDSPLTVYQDAFSPASGTRDAFKILLSFATPQQMSHFYRYKNIIELASDADYQTLWITAQDNLHGGFHDSYASLVVRMSDIYQFSAEGDLHLPDIVQEFYQPDTKQLFFINLSGSHFLYDNFDNIDQEKIPGNGLITDYDRTIHHTDRFMRTLYKMMEKDTSSVFVYISDHGEYLPLKGHGFLGKGTSQFEVPFLIINHSNIKSIDSIVNKYYIPEKSKINTMSVTYTVLELMGYSITHDFVEHVQQQSNYIFHGNGVCYDYDQIELENEKMK